MSSLRYNENNDWFDTAADLSKKARILGNECYKRDNLFMALAQYNKAISFAGDDKIQTALCYGNRSAVYLKLKYFKHCLHNIDLAEPHMPAGKIQKLRDRRRECVKLMKTEVDQAMKPFEYASELSYEQNPKIPFFIDALELKEDPKHGNHIITKQNLKAGDVIAILDPLWKVPINDPTSDCKLACYNCLEMNNGDLIPGKCTGTPDSAFPKCQPLFCSKKCRDAHLENDKDHEGVHDYENLHRMQPDDNPTNHVATHTIKAHKIFLKIFDAFESVDQMRLHVETHSQLNYNFFDFDWTMHASNPKYQENLLLLIMSSHKDKDVLESALRVFTSHPDPASSKCRILKLLLEQNPQNRKFVGQVLSRIFELKAFLSVHPAHTDFCVFAELGHPARSSFNYSCDANAFLHYESHGRSKKIVLTINQPILAGEMITLEINSFYNCDQKCGKAYCIPCRENWSNQIDREKFKKDMETYIEKVHRFYNLKLVDDVLKHRKELCDFINENFSGYHKDPSIRQMIAPKKEQLRTNLEIMGNPMPQVSSFLDPYECFENLNRFVLPDSKIAFVDIDIAN